MPGRKQPEESENERKRDYREFQRRSGGTQAAGDLAQDLDELGARGEIRHERQDWIASDENRRAQSGLPKQPVPGSDEPEGQDGR